VRFGAVSVGRVEPLAFFRSRRVARFVGRCFRAAAPGCLSLAALVAASTQVGNAVANGETRTLDIYHTHTKESVSITYKRNGSFDRAALEKLNWALRDWRRDEPTTMDPRLFDIAWEVHREVGSNEPLHIVSAYRAPETNAMLRRRSRAVAKHSQHMEGKAMDFYLPDASMAKVREIGLRLQRGGVGYYPTAFNPFVHLDAGSVRHWPRMTRDQLTRLFPDGKTVHLPADGKPMPGYDLAAAEIEANGGSVSAYADAGDGGGLFSNRGGKSFFAALFGGADEEEDMAQTPRRNARTAAATRNQAPAGPQMASMTLSGSGDTDGRPVFFPNTSISAAPAEPRRPGQPRKVEPAPAPVVAAETPAPVPAQAAPAEPAPAPSPPVRVASTQPQGLVWTTGAQPVEAPEPAVRPDIPLPLARPAELTGQGLLAANVPLPPQRPVNLASLAPIVPLAPAPQSPTPVVAPAPEKLTEELIAGAAAAPVGVALAYAAVPLPPSRPSGLGPQPTRVAVAPPPPAAATVPPPAQRAEPLVTGALDRTALKTLFATASITGQTAPAAGKVVVATTKSKPVEKDVAGLTGRPASAVVMGFRQGDADLQHDRFAGPAVKPLPVTRFNP
jgi:uncharacterized protein YcbK (DUF882 family)